MAVHTTLSGLDKRFQIISELGSGATGSVFHARDLVLNRAVAIKVLHAGVDPGAIARFQREAQATSKLNHPNLVHVLDFGVDSSNQPYLVMEYLPGRDLKAILEAETKLPVERVLGIAIQLCQALWHAHEKGVLHRDIKPSNVIVQSIHGEERVILVDFGLAKVLGTNQSLTAPGAPVGTVYYLSPETISGKETDARSDLYGLGCVLFECLTGHPPFQGKTAQSTLLMHVNDPIPRLAKGRESFPQEIETLIAKALAKDPGERFQTANELKQALERQSPRSAEVLDNVQDDPVDTLGKNSSVPDYSQVFSNVVKEKPGVVPEPSKKASSKGLSIAFYSLIPLTLIGAIAFGITSQSAQKVIRSEDLTADTELPDVDSADFPGSKKTKTLVIGPRSDLASKMKFLSSEPITNVSFENREVPNALLTQILNEKRVNALEFHNCLGVTDVSLKAISKSQTISTLYLTDLGLKDSALALIAQMPRLETLGLDGNRTLNGDGLKALAKCKTLLRLYIGDTGVTLSNLRWFLKNAPKDFRNIRLANLQLNDQAVRSLDLKRIKTLYLSGNPITIDAINYVASNSKIQLLHLTNCQNVDDSCIAPLQKLNLEMLSLTGTKVSELTGLRNLKHLHQLYLANCALLTDKGLEELTGLQLDKVYVNRTPISDSGLRILGRIQPNQNAFVEFNIDDCPRITKEGQNQFEKMPHVVLSTQDFYD